LTDITPAPKEATMRTRILTALSLTACLALSACAVPMGGGYYGGYRGGYFAPRVSYAGGWGGSYRPAFVARPGGWGGGWRGGWGGGWRHHHG
jgi:hypothetical protein